LEMPPLGQHCSFRLISGSSAARLSSKYRNPAGTSGTATPAPPATLLIRMHESLALLAIGMMLLAAWAIVRQTSRAITQARIRRQRRMLRIYSVVTGAPDASLENQAS